jgi:hypothetical protein
MNPDRPTAAIYKTMTKSDERPSADRRPIYRRLLDTIRARAIPHAQVAGLLFAQQHCGTQDFFIARQGQCHTVPVAQFPHVDFLRHHRQSPAGPHAYRDYLNAEWDYKFPGENTEARREANIQSFLKLYQSVSDRAAQYGPARAFIEPVRVCRRPDGRILIIHGNHRAAAALVLGLDLPARFISPRRFLAKTPVKRVPRERYGDSKGLTAEQSLFLDGREVVHGRDRAAINRFRLIDPADLKNRSVLEFGCGIGSHSFLAAQHGAASVLGVDSRPELISIAIRLNAFFAAPCYFLAADNVSEHEKIAAADTALCFTLPDKDTDKKALAGAITRNTRHVLYIEFPVGMEKAWDFLLNKNYFQTIDKLGEIHCGHPHNTTGILYRCQIRRP